jgi:hypothetical protein
VDSVGSVLDAEGALTAWLHDMEQDGPADDGYGSLVELPDPVRAPEVLLDLAVPHQAINELVTTLTTVRADDAVHDLVLRCARILVRDMGELTMPPAPPAPPVPPAPPRLPARPTAGATPGAGRDDAVRRLFATLVYLAAVPCARAYHERLRVPADVSRRTLADLGRQLAVHQRRHGVPGLLHPLWPARHLRGTLYQLGRLQFERARLGGRTGRAILAAGAPHGPGTPSLELHIPDFSGPLTPAACDRSIELATVFFRTHFPDARHTVAACHSWLLDPDLRAYLPPESNIIRFQDRFRPGYPQVEPDDADIVEFVFGDPTLSVDQLPTDSTLRRAVADHLRAGRHWHGGNGWFPWPDANDQTPQVPTERLET